MNKKIVITIGIVFLILVGIFGYYSITKDVTAVNDLSNRNYIDDLRSQNKIREHNPKSNSYQSYNSLTKEILIEDKDYKQIIKMRLISPYVVSGLIASPNTKVAEFYLEDWKKGKTNLIDEIKFYDAKNNYKQRHDKSVSFMWEKVTEECSGGSELNETKDECYNIYEWIEFETLNELPHKNIKISMWANTEASEKIEWIPMIEGFEVLQWAEWDVSTAVYVGNFSVANQETAPKSAFFKPDGLKMYVSGISNDSVHGYELSMAWNVSTAIHSGLIHVGDKEGNPYGVFFKPDGLKMYVTGNVNDNVNEYDLSVAWNVSTAIYLRLFDTTGEEDAPEGLFFKPDGLKMYIIGEIDDDVHEYNLGMAWNVSSAVWFQLFNTTAQEDSARGLFFSTDGTYMYITGFTQKNIDEYHLGVAWDVSTTLFNQSFDISSKQSDPSGVFFSTDGTHMYVTGSVPALVQEYNLPLTVDTTAPYFIDGTPTNQTIGYNDALNYNINATDAVGFGCFDINDTTNFQINCSGYLQNKTFLGVALYNLNVSINDTTGNENSTLFWVNVTKGIDSFTTLLNGVEANLSVTYPQQVNVSVSGSITAINIDVNGTTFTNANNHTLEGGIWFVNVSTEGDVNYFADEEHWYINVTYPTPHIQFELPTFGDLYNSTSYRFLAKVSLTETYFKNVTFNLYNSTNKLITSDTFVDGTRSFNYTVTYDDTYNYSVITTSTHEKSNETSRIINIDATSPSLTFDVAQTTIPGMQLVPYDISINYTAIDAHIQRCWYNSTWNSAITYLTCNQNLTNISMQFYGIDHTIFIYSNDTFGNEDVASKSVSISAIEIAQSYTNETTEGTISPFQINITIPSGEVISVKDLIYNYTNFGGGTVVNIGGGNYSITKSILIPNVATTTNITFFWNITLDANDILIASSKANQTVSIFGVDNCTINSIPFANFTSVDEEEQNILEDNVTIEMAMNIYSFDRSINVANFSHLYNSTNPLTLCISSDLVGETSYSLDLIIRYEAQDHANEYYNLNRFILDEDFKFQNVFLYDLLSTDSTDFQVTFKGSDFVAVEGALINLQRQYIEENLFKTVELPLTDSNGQTILHLVRNDVVYNIIVIKDNVVLGTFSNIIAFCDDFIIGDCKINLNAFSSSENIFSYDDDIGITFTNPTFNNNTRVISFDFITSDGSIKDINLAVTRNDIFGNNSVCNHSLSSSSGTLLCTVPSYIDDSTLNIEVIVDDELAIKDNVILESSGYGYFGYFIFFVYILAFVFMFAKSKSVILIGLCIGVLTGIALGLIQGKIIGLASSGIWIIVVILIFIWKLNKNREN